MAKSIISLYYQRDREIQAWGKRSHGRLKTQIKSAGIKKYTGSLSRYMRDRYFRRAGILNAVGFKMPRHGVFVEKGVGRGYPAGHSKLGRKPKPWFNPVMEMEVPRLANIAAKHGVDIAAKRIFIN
jgi:hypothetical protein